MRTIKELLQLMLDNQQHFTRSLCFWTDRLLTKDIISLQESIRLDIYIRNNRPSKWSSFGAFMCTGSNWYWPKDKIKPRIKWLKKHIAKN